MKGTDHFKRTIQMYLEQRAAEDELFAKNYRNPAKNMEDCVTYILNYVKKSGCNGFTDGEIFGQADTKTRNCAGCKAGTSRPPQRKKKRMYNPPYLIFDYETENTHTERSRTFEQTTAQTDRHTAGIRFPSLFQPLCDKEGRRHEYLYRVRSLVEE